MITNTLKSWLTKINQPESWLYPKLSEVSNWNLILDRDLVISKISEEIRTGGLIVVCSDYDVDGISSGCIITDCIRQSGGRVSMLVSTRFGGAGYGLSDQMVDRVLALKPVSLVVTCDFGGSDHDRIQRLKDSEIPTCVIDHHVTPLNPLPSYAFLNPNRKNCPSTFKYLCSGGLALSVAGGVLKELGIPKSTIDPAQWIDLAGCASIADVVPLTFDNRSITRKALELISTNPRPGIKAILELSNTSPKTKLSARDIAFKVAPALNSVGRLGDPDIIADLLLSKDINEARSIAAIVKEAWDKRRLITEVITNECIQEVQENNYHTQNSIVLANNNWGHGIVGIVAARIVDKFNKPTAVIGSEGKGSLRGPSGSKLHTALTFCKRHLIKYGGHESAAGVQVDFTKVDDFRKAFNDFHELMSIEASPLDAVDNYLDLDLSDSLEQVEKDLYLLEPTGQGNPKPIIRVSCTIIEGHEVKGGHGKFNARLPNKTKLPCFIISRGAEINQWIGKQAIICGDLRKNEWRGNTTIEMFVQEVTLI